VDLQDLFNKQKYIPPNESKFPVPKYEKSMFPHLKKDQFWAGFMTAAYHQYLVLVFQLTTHICFRLFYPMYSKPR